MGLKSLSSFSFFFILILAIVTIACGPVKSKIRIIDSEIEKSYETGVEKEITRQEKSVMNAIIAISKAVETPESLLRNFIDSGDYKMNLSENQNEARKVLENAMFTDAQAINIQHDPLDVREKRLKDRIREFSRIVKKVAVQATVLGTLLEVTKTKDLEYKREYYSQIEKLEILLNQVVKNAVDKNKLTTIVLRYNLSMRNIRSILSDDLATLKIIYETNIEKIESLNKELNLNLKIEDLAILILSKTKIAENRPSYW